MAVELPPPQTPQQIAVEQVKELNPATAIVVQFQDYTLNVIGNKSKVGKAELQEAVSIADSLSNAVRLINSAYYAAGYPGTKLSYALSGQQLYILVDLGNVTAVTAPPELLPYFEGFTGPLTGENLEPRRALATLHADRADITAEMRLQDNEGSDTDTLVIKKHRKVKPDTTGVKIEASNAGNRFVGRHFIDIDLKGGIPSGDEFRAFWRHGVTGINDEDAARNAEDYNEQILGWNRVTPWGVFGLGGRYAYYDQLLGNTTPVEGIIMSGEAYYINVLKADFDSRLTVQAKLDRTSKETSTRPVTAPAPTCPVPQNTQTECQRELYTSAELGGTYSQVSRAEGWRADWEGSLALRKGLTSDVGNFFGSPVRQDYTLLRPTFRLTLTPTDSDLPYGLGEWKYGLDFTGQYSASAVPEQQQFVLGGIGNLQGFLPGAAVGDTGALVRLRAEWQGIDFYDIYVTPRVFLEYGFARYEEPAPAAPQSTQSLSDVTGEVSLKIAKWFEVTGSASLPLYDSGQPDAAIEDAEANYFLRLTATF